MKKKKKIKIKKKKIREINQKDMKLNTYMEMNYIDVVDVGEIITEIKFIKSIIEINHNILLSN